jgi:hypothetical protein
MGYTTDFEGFITSVKPLPKKIEELFNGICSTRRIARDIKNYGIEGEFYIRNDKLGVIDKNKPPRTQPGLWCHWIYDPSNYRIRWNDSEKFYNYVEWLEYLLNIINIFTECQFSGVILWCGEDKGDCGAIIVKDNQIEIKKFNI